MPVVILVALFSLAVTRAPEISLPPVAICPPSCATMTMEMSPAATRRVLDKLDEADQRIKALEQKERDLKGWWLDTAIVIAGTSVDMLSTGDFRDHPERGLIEGNDLIGNGPGAAEKHVAIKAIGVSILAIVSHELRSHGHPREARVVAVVVGSGFAGLGVRNWLK